MNKGKDILNELKVISPVLASIEKVNVFSVSADYFDNLSQQLLTLVTEKSKFSIQHFNNATINNDIPPGYFDNLANNILSKIQQHNTALEEIKKLSPILYQLQPINVFKVPDNYFKHINYQVLNNIQLKQASKVVNIRKGVFKYAVAAAITGIMVVGFLKFTPTNPTNDSPLPQYVLDGEKIVDIDKELDKINDTEIVKYLQTNGEDIDASLIANAVDEADLPSETDYLIDEKALDNYLYNINENDLKN